MNRAAVPTLETLTGLWTRSLIAWPDGRRDTTTQVFWLQGPGLYADLRQPAPVPGFGRVHRLADVTQDQLDWMATQEGFAGELQFDGEYFEWHRAIDLQPRSDRADRGRLAFEAGLLVEHGESDAYLEHWHRDSIVATATAARLLDENDGCIAYLIRVGSLFMYARGRVAPPPAGKTLAAAIATADTPTNARKLLDFEVAFGHIDSGGWRIERSSLPFRSGQTLEPCATGRSTLSVIDSDFDEGTCERHWRIVDLRGHAESAFALATTPTQEAL